MITFRKYLREEYIKGGLGDNKSIQDIATKHDVDPSVILNELIMGIKVEFEHVNKKKDSDDDIIDFSEDQIVDFIMDDTDNFSDAELGVLNKSLEISKDHLTEMSDYYTKLADMENEED